METFQFVNGHSIVPSGKEKRLKDAVGTMGLTNFQLNSDFKWLLLIPSLLWIIGLVIPTAAGKNGA